MLNMLLGLHLSGRSIVRWEEGREAFARFFRGYHSTGIATNPLALPPNPSNSSCVWLPSLFLLPLAHRLLRGLCHPWITNLFIPHLLTNCKIWPNLNIPDSLSLAALLDSLAGRRIGQQRLMCLLLLLQFQYRPCFLEVILQLLWWRLLLRKLMLWLLSLQPRPSLRCVRRLRSWTNWRKGRSIFTFIPPNHCLPSLLSPYPWTLLFGIGRWESPRPVGRSPDRIFLITLPHARRAEVPFHCPVNIVPQTGLLLWYRPTWTWGPSPCLPSVCS